MLIDHDANACSSVVEAAATAAELIMLIGARVTQSDGTQRTLDEHDIIIAA
jgi:hypothetical protein